jgi:hypothetical protein
MARYMKLILMETIGVTGGDYRKVQNKDVPGIY